MNIPTPGSPLFYHMSHSSSSSSSKSARKASGHGSFHNHNHEDFPEDPDEKRKGCIANIVGYTIMISVFTFLFLWITGIISFHSDDDSGALPKAPQKGFDMDEHMAQYRKWIDSLLEDTNSFIYKPTDDTLSSPQTTHSNNRHRHGGSSSEDYWYDDGYGYDANGYDRDGYDRDGYDRDGYDRDGFDEEGYDEDGIDEEGYDEDGNYEGAY